MKPIAIYVHWPFCLSKCPYCDFNSHILESVDDASWQTGYLKEIDYYAQLIQNKSIASIFFGGGTPSLMNPKIVEAIINKIGSIGLIDHNTEITLEANPTSVESDKFRAFKDAGVNRVSIGVQSFVDKDLLALGREHSADNAKNAIELAAKHFDRFSFDLIYARSGQTLKDWMVELDDALRFAGKHLSLYQLTIEKGTKFFAMHRDGKFMLPDNDLSADMYSWTNEYMHANGFHQYEISNYATLGEECRHNMTYWRYEEYIGIGPGAHSRLLINDKYHARMNFSMPRIWLEKMLTIGEAIQTDSALSKDEIVEEMVMMGLRLNNGIDDTRIHTLTGLTFHDILDAQILRLYIDSGFIEYNDRKLKLSRQGMLLHSYIVPRIIMQQRPKN